MMMIPCLVAGDFESWDQDSWPRAEARTLRNDGKWSRLFRGQHNMYIRSGHVVGEVRRRPGCLVDIGRLLSLGDSNKPRMSLAHRAGTYLLYGQLSIFLPEAFNNVRRS